MKRIKVFRKGVLTNQVEEVASGYGLKAGEADLWLADCLAKNKFGKPERWVTALTPDEDITLALETRQVEVSPAILDDQGVEVEPAKFVTEYKLAAEYTIEIEDVTSERERRRVNQESLALLASTDWYVIRKQETGVEIPQDILEARAAARAAIQR